MRLLTVTEIAMRTVSVDWPTKRGTAGKVLGRLKRESVGRTSCYHSSASVKGGITPCVAKVAQEHMRVKPKLVISQGGQHKGNAGPVCS